MPDLPYLSVIVPAHNEERRLAGTLEKLFLFFNHQPYRTEILIIENASSDKTADVVRAQIATHPNLRLLQTALAGKGRAVRMGMLHATGEWRFFCDADLSMPIEEINKFLPPQNENDDICIGSREAIGAHRYGEPFLRHFTGRVFSWAVKRLVMGGFEDTQCGFKCFRAPAAEALFSRQRFSGWSFDVEVLYLARRMGFRIREIPIPWYYRSDSQVRMIKDSWQMLFDICRIRLHEARGTYDHPNPEINA
jgi:dolichyl-phosphate beta-glucosyltransferase